MTNAVRRPGGPAARLLAGLIRVAAVSRAGVMLLSPVPTLSLDLLAVSERKQK
jgi:hypothetical protein